MSGLLKLLTAAVLGLALAAAPLAAQDIHINPVPAHVKPKWTPVPNVPGAFYAPNLPTDVFRHGSKYYFYWEGYLYRGSRTRGPWKTVKQVPDWFPEIDPSLFKTVKKQPTAPPAGPTESIIPIPSAPASPEAAPPPPPPAPEKKGAPAAPGQPPKVM
jgi:hypothetical protein